MISRKPLGPLLIDLDSTSLTKEDEEIFQHPAVGGVLLFTRNYQSVEQVTALVQKIHALRKPQLRVAVDHEGGRVQRWREPFSSLPSAASMGKLFDRDTQAGIAAAHAAGWIAAHELKSVGIDIDFAPVVDVDHGCSEIIGERAFHQQPQRIAALAQAWIEGAQQGGMRAVLKHFPGHGAVVADSHLSLPSDERSEFAVREDWYPYKALATHPGVAGVMTAHVCFPMLDQQPASFSAYWIKTILRQELGFTGSIFTDDLSMKGAVNVGNLLQRVERALEVGSDIAIICNDRGGVKQILNENTRWPDRTLAWERFPIVVPQLPLAELKESIGWKEHQARLAFCYDFESSTG